MLSDRFQHLQEIRHRLDCLEHIFIFDLFNFAKLLFIGFWRIFKKGDFVILAGCQSPIYYLINVEYTELV